MIAVDSNIWCYYFDEEAKEHRKVAGFLGQLIPKEEILLNTIIVMEVAHFLVRSLGPVRGREKMERFLAFPFLVRNVDYDLVRESIDLLAAYAHAGIGGRDATILAAMKAAGTARLATHDQAFKKVHGIEVIDPLL